MIKKNKSFICFGTLVSNLYCLYPKIISLHDIESNNESNHHMKVKLSFNETYLWHLHLGYISPDKIQRLVGDESLSSLVIEILPIYKSCLEVK